MIAFVDNDVVLKMAAYQLAHLLGETAFAMSADFNIIGVTEIILRNQIKKTKAADVTLAEEALEEILRSLNKVEPSAAESALAAQIETLAIERGLSLDPGESQLLALTVVRRAGLFVTGDKRAIASLPDAISNIEQLNWVRGRVASFEQLILFFLQEDNFEGMRQNVCRNPEVDVSLRACFQCHSQQPTALDAILGLISYVNDLAMKSEGVLVETNDLVVFTLEENSIRWA